MKTVIFGSGSWGTALAQVLQDKNEEVTIYGKDILEVKDINENHYNHKYFSEVELNNKLKATTDIRIVEDADVVVLSVPSIAIESVCKEISGLVKKKIIVVNTSKGFHPITNERMSEVIRSSFNKEKLSSVVSLIGPSHAEEVIRRMLTTVCSISLNVSDAKTIQHLFSNEYFRVYRGKDEIGSELGVAIKNSIALASGMLAGLGYGDNTRAALMTRGLKEMIRFGVKMGGQFDTFIGLSGIGDLIVTCTSVHSRNFQAGYQIGKEGNAKHFLATNKKTVEGIRTTKIVYELAMKHDIEMPIVTEIYRVIYEGKDPRKSAQDLMDRSLKEE